MPLITSFSLYVTSGEDNGVFNLSVRGHRRDRPAMVLIFIKLFGSKSESNMVKVNDFGTKLAASLSGRLLER